MTVDPAGRPLGSISARIFVAISGDGGRNGHGSKRGGRSAGGGKEMGRDRPASSMSLLIGSTRAIIRAQAGSERYRRPEAARAGISAQFDACEDNGGRRLR